MADPYVYPGTNVLRNRLNIRDQHTLDLVEVRAAEVGIVRLRTTPLQLPMGVVQLKATHKAIFGEVYEWAGEFRQNIGAMQKYRPAGYPVVYPPSTYIPQEMADFCGVEGGGQPAWVVGGAVCGTSGCLLGRDGRDASVPGR